LLLSNNNCSQSWTKTRNEIVSCFFSKTFDFRFSLRPFIFYLEQSFAYLHSELIKSPTTIKSNEATASDCNFRSWNCKIKQVWRHCLQAFRSETVLIELKLTYAGKWKMKVIVSFKLKVDLNSTSKVSSFVRQCFCFIFLNVFDLEWERKKNMFGLTQQSCWKTCSAFPKCFHRLSNVGSDKLGDISSPQKNVLQIFLWLL
jgi:hypothetical protein